ncbi:protein phosphatase PHLPP-like protein [Phymastichus coffea]|uniref:protein phosphatase PHLPP-like protein n=1 Tax=Phymastichus coffea TaxID=108790 RepID=UPI00273CA694|nr:protein phosphatase PHLPP-like protein [Phymastichus coffea]
MVITRSNCQWAREAHINWELNERISLSSAGSASRSSSSSNAPNGATTADRKKAAPPEDRPETPVRKRWSAANERLERTNDALARRSNVIQQLNRKIIANRDKMHDSAARKSRWKNDDEPASWSSTPTIERSRCTLSRSERQQEQEQDDSASVLRELNEAIDRFEEEDDLKKQSGTAGQQHDSSWDSGVGAESSVGTEKTTGWLRVHTGIESSLVYLTQETSAADVCRDMLLSDCLALYLQYGGEPGRRLSADEKPLELQEQLLLRLGYGDASRRARLGLDAELRHLIAFHVGPAAPLAELQGYSRCGYALVLKGLVFPQWKKRALAIIGSRLFLYPACSESRPEWMELAAVCCSASRLGKLVLRVTGYPARIAATRQQPTKDDTLSRCNDTRHMYLGFQHPWDRDLWKTWLRQACQSSTATTTHLPEQPTTKLEMSNTGTVRLPDAARAFNASRQFFLGHNQLSSNLDANLKLLLSFPDLQELHLENNRLDEFPRELLSLRNLTFLDLSDNQIRCLPTGIKSLASLKDLIIDRNDIKELPAELGELSQLQYISLVGNLIELLPSFLLEMRALGLNDVLAAKTEEKSNLHNSLYKVNLRNNQLKGNIILGNYGNLTHLDLSENSIEKLDLSALQELRSVRCARNQLTELTLCGRGLVSLIAGNNKLKKLTIVPVPANLEHLDVSYNELESLPDWTPELPQLRALFASHNGLSTLPERLLSQPSRLEVLHLPHNRLQALPPPRRALSLVHLTLQDNQLTALPAHFFTYTQSLKVLNLSNNRLSELAWSYGGADEAGTSRNNSTHEQHQQQRRPHSALEKLYLTGNCLTNTALDALAKFSALRLLHLAYNALDTLPESCIASWRELEELVLSGNKLQYLPDSVANLAHLRVLRVHSNRLLTCPAFSKTPSLKVLDLAHNHLDRLNLDSLLPAHLQFLDISCNSRLHVDPRQFQTYASSRRPLSLVDVSGQSRLSASNPNLNNATTPTRSSSGGQRDTTTTTAHLPWRLGFSETAGIRERLLVSQVRMPTFCNSEGLFGLFDGGSNQEAPSSLQEMIPRLLLEERTVKETRSEYLRYTLLSAHRELREKGQKYGVDAALVHVTRQPALQQEELEKARYLLTAATCGEARTVLCRASGPLQLAKGARVQYGARLQAALAQSGRRGADLLPIALPEPISEEVLLEDDDEFVIIGNRRLWEVLSIQEAVREARAEANPVLAAKRLQDLGQAYGAEDNLSVIVVRLSTATAAPNEPLGRLLIRELRQAVHAKQQPESNGGCTCPCCMPRLSAAGETPAACCCHAAAAAAAAAAESQSANGFYLNGVLRSLVSARFAQLICRSSAKSSRSSQRNQERALKDAASSCSPTVQQREDRSSPSGQSDQTSEVGLFEPRSRKRTSGRGGGGSSRLANACKLRQQQQQQHQHQQQHQTERTPPPSDEQLRCWEYMLEQNTQLLFDKELDTLTSGGGPRTGSSALRRVGQSRSTPQLGATSTSGVPFLSRRFGSARSFDTGPTLEASASAVVQQMPILRSAFGGSGRRLLNGGPNAAYFGSLQRLMPYNLEYDFAVIQERGALDSLEQDASRMQQYWGVATTEL